ncbi:DUF3788 domain-containing protein [Aminivibrio sp.]|uniref:DUF3788 domain-containing protein n=1 Tax=Aminivibrio sp. TaxID=1872489 RepID=UPI00345E1E90
MEKKEREVMNEQALRMTERDHPPTPEELGEWLGNSAYSFWEGFSRFIGETYPGVFSPEWLFGGKKHGWSLRYKKSRSFCTMIPERGRFSLLIVFGAEERAKAEAILPRMSEETGKAYSEAATYHDGKWVLLDIENDSVFNDAAALLAVKRKPKAAPGKQQMQKTSP